MAEGESKQSESRLTREEAKARARELTGESPHIVAGALADESNETFTENQVQKAVKAFVKRPEHREDDEDGDGE